MYYLILFKSLTHSIEFTSAQRVGLNYHGTRCNNDDNTIHFAVDYNGLCKKFNVTVFYEDDIVHGNTGEFLFATTNKTIIIEEQELSNAPEDNPRYVQILPVDDDGEACCDSISHTTFYRYVMRSEGTCTLFPTMINQPVMENVTIPITSKDRCDNGHTIFAWPKYISMHNDVNEYCFCLIYEGDIYSFNDCAMQCGTDYNVVLVDDSVVFYNFTTGQTGFFSHFLCQADPCESTCLLNSIMSTNMVMYDFSGAKSLYSSITNVMFDVDNIIGLFFILIVMQFLKIMIL